MNELYPEEFAAAQKANLEAFYRLASLAVEGWQKLTALNMQAAKSALADSQKLLPSADPQAFFTQQAGPNGELAARAQAYQRALFEIVSGMHTGLMTIAGEQYEAHNRRVQALFETMSRQAPAGSEAAVAALKQLMESSRVLHESVNKSVRQAVSMAEGGFETVLSRTAKASDVTTG
jgi:phasin family protein